MISDAEEPGIGDWDIGSHPMIDRGWGSGRSGVMGSGYRGFGTRGLGYWELVDRRLGDRSVYRRPAYRQIGNLGSGIGR